MQLKISDHTFKKHLLSVDHTASLFFSKKLMFEAINLCVSNPDKTHFSGKRIHAIKELGFKIGQLGYTKDSTSKVKVVYIQTEHQKIIVTAYPSS